MDKNLDKWDEAIELLNDIKKLNLGEIIDYEKFFIYSIITHSTAIEGSTLTEEDTALLFDDGLTAKGKPFVYHLMNNDLKDAYGFAMSEAIKKTEITPDFLRTLNGLVMKGTGGQQNVMAGTFDSSKGDFRLCSVQVRGGDSYMEYQKVPREVDELCRELNSKIKSVSNTREIYNLSFDAHFNLVIIHPWVDGNGRTSRLLMNYIQFYKGVFPSKTLKEDRAEYLETLDFGRKNNDNKQFRDFMTNQLIKTLKEELTSFKRNKNRGFSLLF